MSWPIKYNSLQYQLIRRDNVFTTAATFLQGHVHSYPRKVLFCVNDFSFIFKSSHNLFLSFYLINPNLLVIGFYLCTPKLRYGKIGQLLNIE